jgi:hypothetical protein
MGPPRACACVCAPRAYCGTRARAKGEVPHPLGDSQFDEHAPGAPAPPISHLKVQHGEGTAREFLLHLRERGRAERVTALPLVVADEGAARRGHRARISHPARGELAWCRKFSRAGARKQLSPVIAHVHG